jgi:hypothetical protein
VRLHPTAGKSDKSAQEDKMEIAILGPFVAVFSAFLAAWLTFIFSKKREHEANWRKIKFSKYQEYIDAVSATVGDESASPENSKKYFNAVHNLMLVAPIQVYDAAILHQKETLKPPSHKSLQEHDRLLNLLIREMRKDIHKSLVKNQENTVFHFTAYRDPENMGK